MIHKETLLKAFHKYFMKYVTLTKGTLTTIDNSDTISFLCLFMSKDKKDLMGIYRYINYVCASLEEEDIYHELVIIFIELLNKFKFFPEVSFSFYITKYMRWAIKAWVMKIAQNPLTKTRALLSQPQEIQQGLEQIPGDTESTKLLFTIDLELPELNLGWVIDPSSRLFGKLTQYERFLLYLNFKEGLGVRQISERLGRAKDTIHTQISRALVKLKEEYRKGEKYGI